MKQRWIVKARNPYAGRQHMMTILLYTLYFTASLALLA